MTILFITTDDLCPENMDLWMHWMTLKKKHPRLKLTAFVPAKFHNKRKNDVIRNKDFWKWYKKNRNWVEIAAHGLVHTLPPEFTKFKHYQEKIIHKMGIKLRRYLPTYKGFKPSFYRMNEITIEALKKEGYAYLACWNTIFFFIPMMHNAPQFIMLQSHTNLIDKSGDKYANKDNINLIHEVMHKKLKRFEKRGITYMTIGEYISRFRER